MDGKPYTRECGMRNFLVTWVMLVGASAAGAVERFEALTLAQATQVALERHRSLQVAQASLDLAEAQYQQAMAAFRPRLSAEAGFQRADEDRTFTFSGLVMTPAMDISAALSAPAGSVVLPSQPMPLQMEVKMFDRDTTRAALSLTYPLYTGGKQQALSAMAQKGVAIARETQRKSVLDVVHDVSKYYHGAQYAQQMTQLATDSLARFEVLDELTERLYQNTSLKVKKTDYLRGKTTTALVRSMVQEALYANALSKEALANAMGLALNTPLTLAPAQPPGPADADLEQAISEALLHNPDKQRLELAIQAAGHKIEEAKSGYLPVVGLEATVYQVLNGYHSGLFNDANRRGWTLGVGLKWDLFDGGLTKASVDAAQAEKIRLEAQRVLLDNGLALQIKDDVLRIQRSRAQWADNTQAQGFAEENRRLHVRAYQEELVETKDVIEAQMVATFATASVYRTLHDLNTARSDLDYRVSKALK